MHRTVIAGSVLLAVFFHMPVVAVPQDVNVPAVAGVVIDGETRDPIADAIVSISWAGGGRACVTDTAGRFVLWALGTGAQRLSAKKVGYFDALYGQDTADLESLFLSQSAPRVVLGPRDFLEKLQIVMWRPGSVSGVVTDDVGEPLVGRYVRVLSTTPLNGRPRLSLAGYAVTDDRGMYLVGDLPKGQYLVVVLDAEQDDLLPQLRLPLAFPTTYLGDVRAPTDARAIRVDYGKQVFGADIHVQAVPARQIAGRVTGPPDAGPILRIGLVPSPDPDLGTTSRVATAAVASDGTFVFPSVPSGSYFIVAPISTDDQRAVVAVGRPFPTLPGEPPLAASTSWPYWSRAPVTVDNKDLLDVVVPLVQGRQLRGRVVLDDLAVSANIRMPQVVRTWSAASFRSGPSSKIGTDGRFVIEGLTGGRYFLGPNVGLAVIKNVTADGRDHTPDPFDVTEGSSSDIVMIMTKGAALKGSVRHREGNTSSLATVLYFPRDRAEWRREALSYGQVGFVLAKTDGSYESNAIIPAGHYYVTALINVSVDALRNLGFVDASSNSPAWFVADWSDAEMFLEAASHGAVSVDVAWGETKNVSLESLELSAR